MKESRGVARCSTPHTRVKDVKALSTASVVCGTELSRNTNDSAGSKPHQDDSTILRHSSNSSLVGDDATLVPAAWFTGLSILCETETSMSSVTMEDIVLITSTKQAKPILIPTLSDSFEEQKEIGTKKKKEKEIHKNRGCEQE